MNRKVSTTHLSAVALPSGRALDSLQTCKARGVPEGSQQAAYNLMELLGFIDYQLSEGSCAHQESAAHMGAPMGGWGVA